MALQARVNTLDQYAWLLFLVAFVYAVGEECWYVWKCRGSGSNVGGGALTGEVGALQA